AEGFLAAAVGAALRAASAAAAVAGATDSAAMAALRPHSVRPLAGATDLAAASFWLQRATVSVALCNRNAARRPGWRGEQFVRRSPVVQPDDFPGSGGWL